MSLASEKNKNILTEDFARYEFKYLLPLHIRDAVENEIANFMKIDGHIRNEMDNQYFVRSLYFDSPSNQAFYEKTDGIKSRSKYRIRTYDRTSDTLTPLFLEEKGRHNERTYKHRVQISKEDLPIFLNSNGATSIMAKYGGIEVAENFSADLYRKCIRPKVLVDYIRRPYTSEFDMYFRVTFDQKLQATATAHLFPEGTNQTLACIAGWTIMEVKFNRRIPLWFHRILQVYNLRRLSISKFVTGMKTCHLATDLS